MKFLKARRLLAQARELENYVYNEWMISSDHASLEKVRAIAKKKKARALELLERS